MGDRLTVRDERARLAGSASASRRKNGPESFGPGVTEVFVFGRYRLDVQRRSLFRDGQRVRVGSRAVMILIILVQEAGQIVSKRELRARVWSGIVIEDGTLRVHVAALQKILGESDDGVRHVENVPGHGYRLVVPVSRESCEPPETAGPLQSTPSRAFPSTELPTVSHSIIGRTQVVAAIATSLPEHRWVTITGPGGVGKTTVALGVMEELASYYPHGIYFVDLAAVTEPRLVSGALASALGLRTPVTDRLPDILAFLREHSCLVVLDNCEHLIEAAAQLARSLLQAAPQVHLLATSREPLDVPGERVHRLAALESPPREGRRSREALQAYPAVELFMRRALARGEIEFTEQDLLRVADLCRRLEGNPLAIEIAAARVDLLGLRGLAASLEQGLHLSIEGRRMSVERHRTLRATLDWSYRLLSAEEQSTFRRLAVFSGAFDLQSAIAVVADETADAVAVFKTLIHLTGKSLLVADPSGDRVLYRLLDTSRLYGLEKLRESDELAVIRTRHARLWCTMGVRDVYSELGGRQQWREFTTDVSHPMDREFLARLDVIFDQHPGQRCPAGFAGVPAVAGQAGASASGPWRIARWAVCVEELIQHDFRIAINISAVFHDSADARQESTPLMDQLLTAVHLFAGRLPQARYHAERVLSREYSDEESQAARALQRSHVLLNLSRTLWLLGLPQAALTTARRGVVEAEGCGCAYLAAANLATTALLAHSSGDGEELQSTLDRLRAYAQHPALECFQLWVACLDASAGRRGPDGAVAEISRVASDLSKSSHYSDLLFPVHEELVTPAAIVRAEQGIGGVMAPESLRVKAERMLGARGAEAASEAEAILRVALATAHCQGALLWELRTVMSLARLLRTRERLRDAHALLVGVCRRYTEGFQTADFVAAEELLLELCNDLSVAGTIDGESDRGGGEGRLERERV